MLIENIPWVYPCGCGDTSDPRAEVKISTDMTVRIKHAPDGYYVQRFGPAGALNKDAVGAPVYEPIDADQLAELIALA